MVGPVRAVVLLISSAVLATACGTGHSLVPVSRPSTNPAARPKAQTSSSVPPLVPVLVPPATTPPVAHFARRSFEIAGGGAAPGLPFLAGDSFRLRAGAPAVALHVSPVSCTGESAVRSPDGRYVLSTRVVQGVPDLWVLDVATGAAHVLEPRACDPAWSHTGEIAYLRLTRYDRDSVHPIGGRIFVQGGITGPAVRWSSATEEPLAWAGPALLARSVGQTRLFELQGPSTGREVRGLFAGSRKSAYENGESVSLVAVSPAGDQALLDLQEPVDGYSRDVAGLLGIAEARLVGRKVLPNTQQVLAGDGYWSGEEVVTAGAVYPGFSNHPLPLLITLDVRGHRVEVGSERGFTRPSRPFGPGTMPTLMQPRFLDAANDLVGMWFAPFFDTYQYLECETPTRVCKTGPALPTGVYPQFVANSSRP